MQSILGNTRKADITFHPSGLICIASRVSKLLALSHGDVIDVMDGQGEFYLYVKHRAPTVGRHEGMVFPAKEDSNTYRASSVRLCRFILHQCGVDSKACLCVGTPVTLFHYGTALPIITKNII